VRRFAFRLALALGQYNVDGMLSDMPASLMNEWIAFFGLEPFGWQEDEYRAALITSTVANTARNPKKRRRPFKPADFMRKERPSKQDVASKIKNIFKALAEKKK
jgi:hypothetical protein